MFSWINKVLRDSKSEAGSALAIVLITVVFVGLWFGSVAVLTNSGQSVLKNAVTTSNYNSSIITSMLNQTVQALTPSQSVRYGTLASGCSSLTLPTYTDPTTGNVITVQCYSAPYSGNTYGNSLSLVGTAPSTGTGVVGIDGGLAFVSSNSNQPCTTAGTGRYVVYGGLFNASGAWQNVSCTTLEMNLSTTQLTSDSNNQLPAATQISQAQLYVPTSQTQTPVTSWTGAASGVAVGCPSTTTYTDPAGTTASATAPCSYDTASNISPTNSTSDVGAYMNTIEAGLPDAGTALATYTGETTPGSFVNCTTTEISSGIPAIVWKPGVLNDSLLKDLNTMTNSSGCGKKSVALIFSPGTYKFAPTVPTEWYVGGGATVVLGSPYFKPSTASFNNIVDCDWSQAGGQFQFTGPMFTQIGAGEMYLCPDSQTSGNPTLVATAHDVKDASGKVVVGQWNPNAQANPDNGVANTGDNTKEILIVAQSNNGSNPCAVCFLSEGLVYSPGGSTYIYLTGTGRATFGQGAMWKGMIVDVNGSTKRSVTAKPPVTSFKGDRKVQLKFYNKTQKKVIGVVQLTIKDNFGQTFGSGYKIDTWAVK